MIDFDKIPDMIAHLKTTCFRVRDISENLVFESEEASPDGSIEAFKNLKATLQNYNRLKIQLCSDSNVKQGWKNGFNYVVYISSPASGAATPQQPQNNNGFPNIPGFGLMEFFDLKLQNELLKIKLEKKAEKKERVLPEIPASYLPILQAMGINMGAQPGLAGAEPQRHTLTAEMTGEEKAVVDQKLTEIENTVGSLLGKADIDKVLKVLKAAEQNPALLDSVLPFIK